MLAALLALPAVAFTFVENPAPQGGHMFAATNAFVIEVEEISYPKNPRNNLHLGVGSLQTPTQKRDPSEYPKSPRNNLHLGVGSLQTPTQKKDPSEYPKSPRRNLQFSRKA